MAACEPRAKLVLAQCPVFGARLPEQASGAADFARFKNTLLHGEVGATPATTIGPMPVVSFDPLAVPSLLAPIQAFRWFIDWGGRPGSGWVNRASRVSPPTPVPYSPLLCAPFVTASALLMVAPQDEMLQANYAVARHFYALLPGHKRWHDIADGHFGLLYYPGPRFDEAVSVQTDFLIEQFGLR